MDFSNLKSNIYNKKLIKNKSNIFYIKKKQNKSIEYTIHQNFIKKYKSMPFNYNIYITNNIIFNDKSHLVSKFKEFLVMDDGGEFLKRYYKKKESIQRLPRFFEFYFLYSKLFPNYTSLYENKFLYNNIHQKQRMIDLQEKMEKERKNNNIKIDISYGNDKNFDVFSTDIINSLLKATTNKEGMEMLFDIKNDKLTEEENNFKDGVNHIVDKINDYQNKISINDINSNKNFNCNTTRNKKNIYIHFNSIYSKCDLNNLNNNINSNNKENISQLSNNHNMLLKLMNNKNKIKSKDNNKNNLNKIKNNIIKNRNKENKLKKYLSNKILNINNISKNKSKIKKENEKILIEKMEKELFKMRKRFKKNKNYFSQNISTSIQSKKDFSISKKNISLLNINNNIKNQSISTLMKINDIPSSKVRSTKLSSSNSFIKEINNKKIQNNKILLKNNITRSHKNLHIDSNYNKDKYSRNKQIQNPSTTTNIFNNIIKYINKKYIDSRNKTHNINININTSSKINITNLTNKYKNNKINFNNSNNINDYETQNHKEFDIKNKIRKILYYNKGNKSINLEKNNTILEKTIFDIKSKSLKYIKLNNNNNSNINSAKNLFINSYKNRCNKKIEKKTIDSYNFCESSRNLDKRKNNKNKFVINFTHINLNLNNRTKNNSKENSRKNLLTNLNDKKKKIYDIKK